MILHFLWTLGQKCFTAPYILFVLQSVLYLFVFIYCFYFTLYVGVFVCVKIRVWMQQRYHKC